MGTGYTRNDTANNIADGNIINAADFDGEYDAIEAAFNSSTGHTHDGTSAEGAPIEVVGPSQDVVITASAIRPKTTNTVDLGTSSLEFKDAYFDGTVTADSVNITSGLTIDTINLTSTDAGAAKGPQLDIFRDSASPADNDVLGHIDFSGKDDGDNKTIYASILAEAADVTDTTEDGVLKFNTMVAGSDTTVVTVNADGLTVDGTSPGVATLNSTSNGVRVEFNGASTPASRPWEVGVLNNADGDFQIYQAADAGAGDIKLYTDGTLRQNIDAQTGDISFYEDTGTTAKFFWDASAESLGIGTTTTTGFDSGADDLIVGSGSSSTGMTIYSGTTGYGSLHFADANSSPANYVGYVNYNHSTNSMQFATGSTERMRIDSDGNIGIGLSSPVNTTNYTTLDISGTTGSIINLKDDGTRVGSFFNTVNDVSIGNFTATGFLGFRTNSTERMRIDSDGNVGIGEDSPNADLVVKQSGSTFTPSGNTVALFQRNTATGSGCMVSILSGNNSAADLNFADAQDEDVGRIRYNHSDNSMQFQTNASEVMRIDSSGSVGIGTTSPFGTAANRIVLSVNGTDDASINVGTGGSQRGYLYADSTFARVATIGAIPLQLGTNDTERMRIDSSGNVGIGTSSPTGQAADNRVLQIYGAGTNDRAQIHFANSATGEGTSDGSFIGVDTTSALYIINAENASTIFENNGSERMRIDSSGNVGIGTASPASELHLHVSGASNGAQLRFDSDYGLGFVGQENNTSNNLIIGSSTAGITFYAANSERMRIDSSGVILVGMTSANGVGATPSDVNGTEIGRGYINLNRDDTAVVRHIQFGTNGTGDAALGTNGGDLFLGSQDTCLLFHNDLDSIIPGGVNAAGRDNAIDMGQASNRFDDIYATNGTIQTSDENEKQQIASLTDAEITAAKAISKLFKTFKWNDKVEAKGDAARTHTGVIAQQVETAMSDAGLDAGNYAFFISTTWWETQTEVAAVEADEENGIEAQEAYTRTDTYYTLEEAPEGATERNRKGIRYPELLSFIGAATEQRLTSIEARLDALEG